MTTFFPWSEDQVGQFRRLLGGRRRLPSHSFLAHCTVCLALSFLDILTVCFVCFFLAYVLYSTWLQCVQRRGTSLPRNVRLHLALNPNRRTLNFWCCVRNVWVGTVSKLTEVMTGSSVMLKSKVHTGFARGLVFFRTEKREWKLFGWTQLADLAPGMLSIVSAPACGVPWSGFAAIPLLIQRQHVVYYCPVRSLCTTQGSHWRRVVVVERTVTCS